MSLEHLARWSANAPPERFAEGGSRHGHRPALTGLRLNAANGSVSGRLEARKENEIVGHDRGPDISFEVVEAAPRTAPQTVSALQT